jgi:hypothetical protein
MTENNQESEVWVEYLYDGTWLMKIHEDKLLGYLIRGDPCNYQEDEAPYEQGLISDFVTYAKNLGLKPVVVDCVGFLFDQYDRSFTNEVRP